MKTRRFENTPRGRCAEEMFRSLVPFADPSQYDHLASEIQQKLTMARFKAWDAFRDRHGLADRDLLPLAEDCARISGEDIVCSGNFIAY